MAANPRLPKIMRHQMLAAIKEQHPHLIPIMDEADCRVWHFLVCNLPAPYLGGEYFFRLSAPKTFPRKPPTFEFLTPNGVFEIGGKICISIGEFHTDDAPGRDGSHGWRPALGMRGFAREVVNGMLIPETLGSGIRVVRQPTVAGRRAAAGRSAGENARWPYLLTAVDDYVAANEDAPAARGLVLRRAGRRLAQRIAAGPADIDDSLVAAALGDCWATAAPAIAAARAAGVLPELYPALGDLVDAYTPSERKALALALAVLVLCKTGGGLGPGLDVLRAAVLNVGGAQGPAVAEALARVTAPAVYAAAFPTLSRFVLADDIDRRATISRVLIMALAPAPAADPEAELLSFLLS